jgi:hypothetical protein
MAQGLKQTVKFRAIVNPPPNPVAHPCTVEHTLVCTHKNIRSTIKAAVDQFLVQYNTMAGAKIRIEITACEPDEFANPER